MKITNNKLKKKKNGPKVNPQHFTTLYASLENFELDTLLYWYTTSMKSTVSTHKVKVLYGTDTQCSGTLRYVDS